MRPKISIEGLDLNIGISTIDITDSECDTLRLDEQRDGTWELTVSKSISQQVVDRLKCIDLNDIEREQHPCYAVWKGTGFITTLRPRDVNELRNDGHLHGGFIHFTRHPGENWELHTCDTFNQKIETRKMRRIHFNWNVYK